MRGAPALVVASLLLAAGCRQPSADFSTANARAIVEHLGGDIGSRPAGSAANAKAREYLAGRLTAQGFNVRVQSADAVNARFGVSGRVHNIVATAEGSSRDAVALMAHYDSVPEGPGAADDGFGTAVVVEAARALAARGQRRWSLMVLLTDAEEEGLLGAEALVEDPEVRSRVKLVVNVEAMGGDAPVRMFEAGPGNGWLAAVWARATPLPRGASFDAEIYRRMPNDTDFSVFRRAGIPGFNLSATGDIYSYHTALDVPARVTDAALAQGGSAVVALADALEDEDITRRTADEATYFDLVGRTAVAWPRSWDTPLWAAALLAGLVALTRSGLACARHSGARGIVAVLCWAAAGLLVVAASAVGAAALLRTTREVYHPWHAEPLRFLAAIALSAASGGWVLARLSAHLPRGVRPPRSGAAALVPTLIVWTALSALAIRAAPGAAYLFVLPLVVLAAPVALAGAGRLAVLAASIPALLVAAALWAGDTHTLFKFLAALMGGLPVITPVWLLPAVVLLTAVMAVPAAIVAAVESGCRRPRFATRALLVTCGFALAWAYQAPAYTSERPLRLLLASVSGEPGRQETVTIVAGNEPIPALGPDAPALTPVVAVPERFARYADAPFAAIAPPGPVRRSATTSCTTTEGEAIVTVVPHVEGASARLELPEGLHPTDATPPGAVRNGRWAARIVAVPAAGAVFRLGGLPGGADRACDGRLTLRLPRPADPATGQLPGWLAHPGIAWAFRVVDVLPLR